MNSDDIKKTATGTIDQAGRSAEAMKRKADETTDNFSSMAQDRMADASDKASDLYGKAKSAIGDAADRLPGSASDAIDASQRAYKSSSATIAGQVSKQPIEALLLAGAIGYLVGWAANRG